MAFASYRTTVEEIYHAASDPDHWSQALEKLTEYVGGSGALIAHHDLRSDTGALISARLREDIGALYVRHYGNNPYSVAILRHPAGTAKLGRDLVERESIRRTAFHADILAPQGIVDKVMVGHAPFMTPSHTGGFAVMFNGRAAEDGEIRRQRMARIAPHLSAILEISQKMASLSFSQRRLHLLLEAMSLAAIIVDAHGQIEGMNSAAETLVGEGNGLTVATRMQLTTSLRSERHKLTKILAGAQGVEGVPCLCKIARIGQSPLILKAVSLPPAAKERLWAPDRRESILVQIIDPDKQEPGPAADNFRDLFGLTVSEQRVAILVGQGLSAPDAAARLGISVTTVRTHLARCFEKLGVRSQPALARLLTQLEMLN